VSLQISKIITHIYNDDSNQFKFIMIDLNAIQIL